MRYVGYPQNPDIWAVSGRFRGSGFSDRPLIIRSMSKTFNLSAARKAAKLAQELGLTIYGFGLTADGEFRLMTAAMPGGQHPAQDGADAALDAWMRSQGG